jgi:cytochrome b subunit of formate dehydrogenase
MSADAPTPTWYFRFSLGARYLHGLLIFCFLGLAATGMTLFFSSAPWASAVAHGLGGFRAILFLHKGCGVLLSAGFVFHVGHIAYRALVKREKGLFWGPTSMVPQPRDLVDLYRHVRWFLWLGPKPRFDRFTYWEKFDYWAVFWGMVIIGVSGWMMWFAPFFARFVPGSAFNIALLIHGEEALLAVWFIFMIHWFNADFRPDKFPMDEVIFTGRISEETLREERPLEYERLAQQGSLPALETGAAPRWLRNLARLIGVGAFAVGFALLIVTFAAFFREL